MPSRKRPRRLPGCCRNFSAPFIRRPIATGLMMAAVVLLGAVGYELLPVASLPNVKSPDPGNSTAAGGRSADDRRIRRGAARAAIRRDSRFGADDIEQRPRYTQITLQFSRDRAVSSAAQDVQGAINAASGELPTNLLSPPTYRKTNPADRNQGRDRLRSHADYPRERRRRQIHPPADNRAGRRCHFHLPARLWATVIPARTETRNGRSGDRKAEPGAGAGPGHHPVHAGRAGHQRRARLSKTQYQYTLVDVDSQELNHWVSILLQR